MKTHQQIYVNRKNAVLILVDVENEFCKPGGKRYTETSSQFMPAVISSVKKLLELARSAGIPIVYIQSVRTHQEAEFTVFNAPYILREGTWSSEIVNEVKPLEGDTIVRKYCHDPFFNTDLDKVLRKLTPTPTGYYAIVAGGAANICLYHAVMGFHLRDYWTVVPVDCIYYKNEVCLQRALEQFSEGAYPNIFLSRSDLIKIAESPELANRRPVPGT